MFLLCVNSFNGLPDWHYRKMKRLAVACGDSCDSLARAVGEEVLEETAT